MNKFFSVITSVFLIFILTGCVAWWNPSKHPFSTGVKHSSVLYSGPKAEVTVTDFEVKATKAELTIGPALHKMLVGALLENKHFLVAGLKPQGKADLIITAVVVEFEPEASGGKSGIGGGGGAASGALGGLLGAAVNKAHLALDIRIADAATSEVLASTVVQGQAADILGNPDSGVVENRPMVEGLSAYTNTPMEKAINACITDAANYITQIIPAKYYKY